MENNHTEELSTREILAFLAKFLKQYVCQPIVFLLRFVVKKWWQLAVCCIVAFCIMVGWCKLFPEYKGDIMFQNNVWRSSDFILKLRQLNLEDKMVVAKKLNMNPEVVMKKKMISPHFVYFTDSLQTACMVDSWDLYYKPHEDKMWIMTSRFSVEIRATSLEALDGWTEGLLYYFNNDPYINVLGRQRKQGISHRISMVSDEIDKLDSLQMIEYFDNSRRNVSVNGMAVASQSPSLYHNEVLSLSERLDDYNSMLQYDSAPLVVVTDMQKEAEAINDWHKYILTSVLWGFCLGLLLLLAIDYRKPVYAFLKGPDNQ